MMAGGNRDLGGRQRRTEGRKRQWKSMARMHRSKFGSAEAATHSAAHKLSPGHRDLRLMCI
jgi:hypothetical protein